ncbi:MAG: RNA methyltransferase [Bifidobacteriaceae bacterium]|jgi:TrmH family RNA methyltransferase|nr:RNA methyltransferase [Bifidobacteriaceae bacterium]
MASQLGNKNSDRAKFLRKLTSVDGQRKFGKFICSTKKVVEVALDTVPQSVEDVYLADAEWKDADFVEKVTAKGVYLHSALDSALNSIDPNAQGCIAVIKDYDATEISAVAGRKTSNFSLYCNEIRDPGNLGTLIRLADAFAARNVYVSPASISAKNVKVLRASAGSFFHLPIYQNFPALELLNDDALYTVASVVDADGTENAVDIKQAISDANGLEIVLFLGNESLGLPHEITDACNAKVNINMPGNAESLNVAGAGAVLMYLINE